MKIIRDIIEIDEQKCNGCGLCILSCAEGALVLMDGKARVLREPLCDGLGACLSACPADALKIVQKESEAFDEKAVHAHLEASKNTLETDKCERPRKLLSSLENWPVQLRLIPPSAPFLKNADLLLLADCVGIACPGLHQDLLPGKRVIMTCPKLENPEDTITRLAALFKEAWPHSLELAIMEVPCCSGLERMAKKALEQAGINLPFQVIMIRRNGEKEVQNASLRPAFF